MICNKCSNRIDEERLVFLRQTNRPLVCTNCTNESKQIGLMDYGHKTAPQLVLLPENEETKRIAFRAFRRAR